LWASSCRFLIEGFLLWVSNCRFLIVDFYLRGVCGKCNYFACCVTDCELVALLEDDTGMEVSKCTSNS